MSNSRISTQDDFKKFCYEDNGNKHFTAKRYEVSRGYYSIVFDMIKGESDNINTSLEIGSEEFLCIKNSEVFEGDARVYWKNTHTDNGWKKYKHKQFDMVIALEVWEHLWNINIPEGFIWPDGGIHENYHPSMVGTEIGDVSIQQAVFREVMRVSKNAILSFPYMWGEHNGCPTNNCHYQIDREIIKKWTCGVEPIEIVDAQHNSGIRTVYRWEF